MVGERILVVDDDNEKNYHGATATIPHALYGTTLAVPPRRRTGHMSFPQKVR